jgi:hypothetical protein
VKKSVALALVTLFSFGTVAYAAAASANGAAPPRAPDAGIEVIVVTAKWPVVEPVVVPAVAAQPSELIVTGKRATKAAERTPPVMAVEIPTLELAVEPLVVRL